MKGLGRLLILMYGWALAQRDTDSTLYKLIMLYTP